MQPQISKPAKYDSRPKYYSNREHIESKKSYDLQDTIKDLCGCTKTKKFKNEATKWHRGMTFGQEDLKMNIYKFCCTFKVPLLDALAIRQMDEEEYSSLVWVQSEDLKKSDAFTDINLREALMIHVFYVLTKGSFISDHLSDEFPRILVPYLSKEQPLSLYAQILTSNNMKALDSEWIRKIPLSKFFTDDLFKRITKMVTGYRLMNAVYVGTPRPNLDLQTLKAVSVIKKMYAKGLYWDFNPIFRNYELYHALGSFQDNLLNLIDVAFDAEEINNLKEFKLLHVKPNFDSRHVEFMNWDESLMEKLKWPIKFYDE
ncbi:hypothetical protein CWI36_1119p0020 [Hamiltosporidium magnivora]|uniref:Uncharacterized protein n=1 Tax=Hamiltosporidium magnivora TaxID=148818 RepID=A0A4Q9L4H5_9MICR|nr:hypothetical protein CWI36_1119p0020 [Hamiltosporidium magnivora]